MIYTPSLGAFYNLTQRIRPLCEFMFELCKVRTKTSTSTLKSCMQQNWCSYWRRCHRVSVARWASVCLEWDPKRCIHLIFTLMQVSGKSLVNFSVETKWETENRIIKENINRLNGKFWLPKEGIKFVLIYSWARNCIYSYDSRFSPPETV